jgi:spermidine/putrescine transport system permease protein
MTATVTPPVSVEDRSAPPPQRRRPKVPKFALAIPSWVWYLGFFIVPVLVVVWYSFGYKPPVTAGQGPIGTDQLSLDNYREALSDTFFKTFQNTLRVAITGTLLCLVIGFPVAYFIAVKMPAKWRGLMLALVIIPFWTSFLIRTIAWRIVLAPEGWLSHFMQTVGLRDTPIRFLDTREAVQLGVVYNYLPLMIFPLFVALDRLDPALREASKDLGASRVKTFLQVTLPLAAPGMVAGLLLVFIPLAGDYITASVLGGAKGNMAGALVATQFLAAQNWALGSAMAVVLIFTILASIAIAAVIALVVRAVIRKVRAVDVALPATVAVPAGAPT